MLDDLDTHHGSRHLISRSNIYDDCIELYTTKLQQLLTEYPFRVKFTKEKAIDTGGVARDMFSGFWERAYVRCLDGQSTFIPNVHPHVNLLEYRVLGTIMSHGFMMCGFLPIRVAFPVLAYSLLGCDIHIPDSIIIDSFIDYVSVHESSVIVDALKEQTVFSPQLQDALDDILAGMGCREIPTPSKVQRLVLEVAKHELCVKPLGAMCHLHAGVPAEYLGFLKKFSVEKLFNLFKALCATPDTVMKLLAAPEEMDANQTRVFNYLKTFIGNLAHPDIDNFLRFCTGSSVVIGKQITVSFNSITGLARRPIAHACGCILQLPISYLTYPDFADEFLSILRSKIAWPMHGL